MGMLQGALPVRLAAGRPSRAQTAPTRVLAWARALLAPIPAGRASTVASAAVLALEAIGSLLMWAPIPLSWMWVGGQVFSATGSLAADGAVAFLGFMATTWLAMSALNRLDAIWVSLRCKAGHDQKQGALTHVVVVSATLGILAFLLWYYVIERAFVLPFMPSQ
jgi:hypothetical protein